MGNTKSGALSKELLEDLKLNTKYSEQELCACDGTLDFKEYIVALHLTSSGKTVQKLEWAFALYDVDGNGTISKNEIQEIVKSIFNMISSEDQKILPDDENTPEKRADKIWDFFGKKDNDKIAEGEFIRGVMDNKEILRLIQFDEPQKVKDKLKEMKQ
ncbi:hypothetical protein AAFF_G00123150 [Aldrovandia affinis]|uniref:EF-hand domain-containing protein n=1 Tax=Aldrovandia affinis TaxID=143900 RepID=A0AAD7RRM2_9TELE|nr:hypothetical protein AAFF_G00123150 [Aldrovandia affinis]